MWLASTIDRLAGSCPHNAKPYFLVSSAGDGTVRPSTGLQEDYIFGLPRQLIDWRDHARTVEIIDFSMLRLRTERWASR